MKKQPKNVAFLRALQEAEVHAIDLYKRATYGVIHEDDEKSCSLGIIEHIGVVLATMLEGKPCTPAVFYSLAAVRHYFLALEPYLTTATPLSLPYENAMRTVSAYGHQTEVLAFQPRTLSTDFGIVQNVLFQREHYSTRCILYALHVMMALHFVETRALSLRSQ